jgi:hypothetical protein
VNENLDNLWDRTPRALLAVSEINVCVWKCTPLLGGQCCTRKRYLRLLEVKYGGLFHIKQASDVAISTTSRNDKCNIVL